MFLIIFLFPELFDGYRHILIDVLFLIIFAEIVSSYNALHLFEINNSGTRPVAHFHVIFTPLCKLTKIFSFVRISMSLISCWIHDLTNAANRLKCPAALGWSKITLCT